MINSKNYTISYLVFIIASSLQLLWIAFSQILPIDLKNIYEIGLPVSVFVMITGCITSAIYGILALKNERVQLLWVVPQLIYLGVSGLSLINHYF